MAKIGEGDQRWIVKERDDGQNCNVRARRRSPLVPPDVSHHAFCC